MHELVGQGCQFIIATHSPLLLAYPEATIYQFTDRGIESIAYEDTDHYQVTRTFLLRRESMLRQMLTDEEPEAPPAEPPGKRSRMKRPGGRRSGQ